VLSEDRLELRFHRRRDPRDAEILGRSKTEVARVNRSYFTKGRLHHPSILVDNTATQNVKTIEPVAIGAFVPTDRILNRGKMVSTGSLKCDARAFLYLALEPLHSAILDGVFQSSMLAVGAVSEVPLRGQDGIADFINLVGSNKTQHIG